MTTTVYVNTGSIHSVNNKKNFNFNESFDNENYFQEFTALYAVTMLVISAKQKNPSGLSCSRLTMGAVDLNSFVAGMFHSLAHPLL